MNDDQAVTLQDVFEYIRDVTRQTQLIIEDTAEALRKETKCHFEHMRSWDYVEKPNDHLLDTRIVTPRAWMTYVPEGHLSLAVLFHVQFYGEQFIVPALMYGSLDPGEGRSFGEIDRWASFSMTRDIERGKDGITAEQDPPFTVVTSTRDNCFSEARLIRVPLESITDQEALQRIVVKPLAALVQGKVEEARESLKGVKTIPWPGHLESPEDQEESEEAEVV